MTAWRGDDLLADDQTATPVLWARLHRLHRTPDVSDAAMVRLYGDVKAHQRLRTWGHTPGEDVDLAVHYLSTRGGTNLHTDPGYLRFTHQLVLRNDGFVQHGLAPVLPPVMEPGCLSCLDTHSPHKVAVDPRVKWERRGPRYKVALAVDRAEPLDPDEAWALLSPRLADVRLPPCAPGRHTRF
jgi:hypothetical protein